MSAAGACAGLQAPASLHPTLATTAPPAPQAYIVLLAALLALLPLENAEGAELEADERLLRELAASKELDTKLGGGGGPEDAHGAVLKLAWGVLLSQYGPESAAGAPGAASAPGAGLGLSAGRRAVRAAALPASALADVCCVAHSRVPPACRPGSSFDRTLQSALGRW